ncbi:protein sprouty homolog 2 [Hoplias malabaricus]|uniref:protein sprouty homolog 2 n=1 Tax=Hoplias malabaricus TaxID=27720 RepID=UPI003461E448
METRAQGGGGGGGGEEAPMLSLQQICCAHVSNEYTEGPVASSGHPQSEDVQPSGLPEDSNLPLESTVLPGYTDSRHFQESQDSGASKASKDLQDPQDSRTSRDFRDSSQDSRSLQIVASRSTSGTSEGSCSNSSEQRLLGNASKGSMPVVQAQPKSYENKKEELKPLVKESEGGKKHPRLCQRCQKCKCEDCRSPRSLPSCWICGKRCVCSAESTVDYLTCVCCLKCCFYHCSSDDEDVCADKPFSCSSPHCCVRWSSAGALALILPCLLCYLPARGCLKLCQICYNRTSSPGCRCRGADKSHAHKVST